MEERAEERCSRGEERAGGEVGESGGGRRERERSP